MMKSIKEFYSKHRELIRYLFFGVITTVVSLLACYLTLKLGVSLMHDENGEPTHLLDAIGSTVQWISGVLVAFYTNKKWVFENANDEGTSTAKQLAAFSGSRVGTYFLELVMNIAIIRLFELFGYRSIELTVFTVAVVLSSRLWAKLISSVVVVVTNYFISKLFVFRKKTDAKGKSGSENE